MVKASSTCALSFQISVMPEVNEGSLLAYILEKLCDKNFKRKFNPTEMAA